MKWLVYRGNDNKIMPIIQQENLKALNAFYFVRRFANVNYTARKFKSKTSIIQWEYL